jgi:hypothetical protein
MNEPILTVTAERTSQLLPNTLYTSFVFHFKKRLLSSTGHFARLKKVTRLGVGSFFLVMGYPAFCQTPFAETIL